MSTVKSIEISTHPLPKSKQKQSNLEKDQALRNKRNVDVRGAMKEMFGESAQGDTTKNKVGEKSKGEARQGRD